MERSPHQRRRRRLRPRSSRQGRRCTGPSRNASAPFCTPRAGLKRDGLDPPSGGCSVAVDCAHAQGASQSQTTRCSSRSCTEVQYVVAASPLDPPLSGPDAEPGSGARRMASRDPLVVNHGIVLRWSAATWARASGSQSRAASRTRTWDYDGIAPCKGVLRVRDRAPPSKFAPLGRSSAIAPDTAGRSRTRQETVPDLTVRPWG